MRLFLHGRSSASTLETRLAAASQQQISSILIASWNVETQMEMTRALCQYLRTIPPGFLQEVTLQNSQGDLKELVAAILKASPEQLVVRFDKQRSSIPSALIRGLAEEASQTRLRKIVFRGMTLTTSAVMGLERALPKMQHLNSLAIQSKIVLRDVDRKDVSIFSSHESSRVVRTTLGLLQKLPNLKSLDLEDCHIPDEYLAELLEACPMSLTHLMLKGNQCEGESLSVIYDWLANTECQLQELNLRWQRLPNPKRNVSMLRYCNKLSKGLLYNKSLQTLILSDNRLTDDHIENLVTALERNRTLQTLEMAGCRITTEGMEIISSALPSLRLKRVLMHGQQRVSKPALLKDLFVLPMTQNVYLHDLTLPKTDSKRLEWLLEWNRAGRRVLLEPNTVPPSLWPILLAKANDVGERGSYSNPQHHAASAIYYLLREKGLEAVTQQHERSTTGGATATAASKAPLPVASPSRSAQPARPVLRRNMTTASSASSSNNNMSKHDLAKHHRRLGSDTTDVTAASTLARTLSQDDGYSLDDSIIDIAQVDQDAWLAGDVIATPSTNLDSLLTGKVF